MLTFRAAGTPVRRSSQLLLAVLVLTSFASLGPVCGPLTNPDPEPSSDPDIVQPKPPIVRITLNGIPADTNQLLAVPTSGFVINVDWEPTDAAVDRASLSVLVAGWDDTFRILTSQFASDADGAWLVLPAARALPEGSFTIYATVSDVAGNTAQSDYSFAARDFANGTPPIGSGQEIWFDFESDRDATPGPDFDVDLETLGLASPSAPAAMNEFVRAWVIEEILERVRSAYYDSNPAALPEPDPIPVSFSDADVGAPDATRICVGGEDPTGGITLGNVVTDPNNARGGTIECGSIPPTGVFPREILMYAGQAEFQSTIDALRPAAGGTPIGEHPADAVVLDPSFDPGTPGIPLTHLSRFVQVRNAVRAFGRALGTVLAHESGHALGLVPPAAPGVGLYGGATGARTYHNEMPDGTLPRETYLMNHGGSFTFAELAGLSGEPPAEFRPLNHAYLRDRVVLASDVTALLPPPALQSVDPAVVSQSVQAIHLYGEGFAATPAVTLSNDVFIYQAIGEAFVSDSESTAVIVRGQVAPGVYDVTLVNPDGQSTYILDAVTVE